MTPFEMVAEFHRTFARTPDPAAMIDTLSTETLALRQALVEEESDEAARAVMERSKPKILQELTDLMYVVIGWYLVMGISEEVAQSAFEEVHKANMSKLDDNGKVVRRPDGKVMKGPNYKAPDMVPVLNKHYNIW